MARYIDADALVEEMNGLYQTARDDYQELLVARAIELVHNAPTDVAPVRHGEWASTKDKLPEPGVEVIVCTMEDGEVDMEIGYWYDRGGIVRWVFPSGNRPVHYWMPLPEMPKVDGGANNG